MSHDLTHYGIIGQKWGVRRYQNQDGTYTELGKERRRSSSGLLAKKTPGDYVSLTTKRYRLKSRIAKKLGLPAISESYNRKASRSELFDKKMQDKMGNRRDEFSKFAAAYNANDYNEFGQKVSPLAKRVGVVAAAGSVALSAIIARKMAKRNLGTIYHSAAVFAAKLRHAEDLGATVSPELKQKLAKLYTNSAKVATIVPMAAFGLSVFKNYRKDTQRRLFMNGHEINKEHTPGSVRKARRKAMAKDVGKVAGVTAAAASGAVMMALGIPRAIDIISRSGKTNLKDFKDYVVRDSEFFNSDEGGLVRAFV